ncbi:MAG TPA: hypothetical protein VGG54_22980 [Trebonia sp.]|jgi:hypothetical protein
MSARLLAVALIAAAFLLGPHFVAALALFAFAAVTLLFVHMAALLTVLTIGTTVGLLLLIAGSLRRSGFLLVSRRLAW